MFYYVDNNGSFKKISGLEKYTVNGFRIIMNNTSFVLQKYHQGVKPKMRGWGISGFRKEDFYAFGYNYDNIPPYNKL